MSLPNKDSRLSKKVKIFEVSIDEDFCKGCSICVDFCPREVFVESESINPRGYYQPKIVVEVKCTGCKLCELLCPELAIVITEKQS